MEISIFYQDRVFSYIKIGKNMTWVDEWHVIVPTILHPKLYQAALDSGADPKIFAKKADVISRKATKTKTEVNLKAKKSKSKSNLISAFNPFRKEEKGE